MPHKVRTSALKELDRRLTDTLKDTRAKLDTSEEDPLKRVVIEARFAISSIGIHPPLSITDVWKHCTERFPYLRSVSIRKRTSKIAIYVRR